MKAQSKLVARLFVQNTGYVGGMGALLFTAAGTFHWPAAWHFLIAMAVLGLSSGLWLAKINPDLLSERMKPMMQHGQPPADRTFVILFGAAALIWFITMGLEARHRVPHPSATMQTLGLGLLVGSTILILWVMQTNSFAIPVVRVQTERRQRTIDSGPYAFVRHPMYSATFLFFAGCLWRSVRGGDSLLPPYSCFSLQFVPSSRSACWLRDCRIMWIIPRACGIGWCRESGRMTADRAPAGE